MLKKILIGVFATLAVASLAFNVVLPVMNIIFVDGRYRKVPRIKIEDEYVYTKLEFFATLPKIEKLSISSNGKTLAFYDEFVSRVINAADAKILYNNAEPFASENDSRNTSYFNGRFFFSNYSTKKTVVVEPDADQAALSKYVTSSKLDSESNLIYYRYKGEYNIYNLLTQNDFALHEEDFKPLFESDTSVNVVPLTFINDETVIIYATGCKLEEKIYGLYQYNLSDSTFKMIHESNRKLKDLYLGKNGRLEWALANERLDNANNSDSFIKYVFKFFKFQKSWRLIQVDPVTGKTDYFPFQAIDYRYDPISNRIYYRINAHKNKIFVWDKTMDAHKYLKVDYDIFEFEIVPGKNVLYVIALEGILKVSME